MIHNREVAEVEIVRVDGSIDKSGATQCGHCTALIRMVAGSGRRRGWCPRCERVLCGAPACAHVCRPWEEIICPTGWSRSQGIGP